MSQKSDKLKVVKLRLAFYRKTYVLFHTINNDYFTKYILLVTTSSHSYRISYKLQQHDGHINNVRRENYQTLYGTYNRIHVISKVCKTYITCK